MPRAEEGCHGEPAALLFVAMDGRPPHRGADEGPGGDVREEVGLVVDAA